MPLIIFTTCFLENIETFTQIIPRIDMRLDVNCAAIIGMKYIFS